MPELDQVGPRGRERTVITNGGALILLVLDLKDAEVTIRRGSKERDERGMDTYMPDLVTEVVLVEHERLRSRRIRVASAGSEVHVVDVRVGARRESRKGRTVPCATPFPKATGSRYQ